MPKLVSKDAPKVHGKFYGAPCLPTTSNKLWECDSKEEYQAFRGAYEESEGNCNTCRFLERVKHEKDPQGWIPGVCTKIAFRPAIRFHPEDPIHNTCWESRRLTPKTTQ